MTRSMRIAAIVFAILVAVPAIGDATIQSFQKLITVSIQLVVTNPILGAVPNPAPVQIARGDASAAGIKMKLILNERESPQAYHAELLHFVDGNLVAQTNQGAVRIEAAVSPNPNATELYQGCGTNNPAPPAAVSGLCQQGQIVIPVTTGITTTLTCAYAISVNTIKPLWTLYHGLTNDFQSPQPAPSPTATVPGGDVKNSTYATVPGPAFTPFVVFADDGGVWAQVGTGSNSKTYCVDLKILVPNTARSGTYSSVATYLLYF